MFSGLSMVLEFSTQHMPARPGWVRSDLPLPPRYPRKSVEIRKNIENMHIVKH
jgi:hypothetical protein